MNKILESSIVKHLPRFARVREAVAVHAVLWAARDAIPITATDFDSEHSLEWVRGLCHRELFWVVEIDSTIAGVMLLDFNDVMERGRIDIFYLATAEPYQRRRVATALLAYAKNRHSSLTAKTKPDNVRTMPIRLMQTPTTCGMRPFAGIERGVSRRLCPAGDAKQ
jgi:GNAT superfamily N-acetyltransferase